MPVLASLKSFVIACLLTFPCQKSRIYGILAANGEQYGLQEALFYPLHVMPPFKKYFDLNPTYLKHTENLAAKSFSLPTGAGFDPALAIEVKSRLNLIIDALE